jgi:type IV conjugative transfer system lipoprotein TraV
MKTKFPSLICLIFLIFQSCSAPKYGCPYGEGVTCKSVDTIYRESLSGELDKEKEEKRTLRQIEQERKPRKLGGSEVTYTKNNLATEKGTSNNSQAIFPSNSTYITFNPNLKSTESDTVPLRTPPEIVRVWIAPWEDTNGALHGGNYIYLVVNSGKWIIENKEIEGENIIPLESAKENMNGNTTEKAPGSR